MSVDDKFTREIRRGTQNLAANPDVSESFIHNWMKLYIIKQPEGLIEFLIEYSTQSL